MAWAIPQFLAAPFLGMLSDRFGRRPVILISVFGVGAELVMGALAPTIGWLMAARILCGLTCGAQAAAMAYVADVTPPEDRTRAYGWTTAALWSGSSWGRRSAACWRRTIYGRPSGSPPPWRSSAESTACSSCRNPAQGETRAHPLGQGQSVGRGGPAGPAQGPAGAGDRPAADLAGLPGQGQPAGPLHRPPLRLEPAGLRGVLQRPGRGKYRGADGVDRADRQGAGDRRTVLLGLALEIVGFAAVGLAPTGVWFWIANLPVVLGSMATPALQSLMSSKVGRPNRAGCRAPWAPSPA
uniref:MFS transporter n=1 Tax=Phenylobacterium glaciei TaxID=2803784 RepID=A0A974S806_9CAUL|nr:MFS transporter [Phenylobacterium glaciei]